MPSALRNAPVRRPTVLLGLAGAALAGALGWLALETRPAGAPARTAALDGKLADRLSFVEEDVPVRHTRIFDTVAMFALAPLEAGPWSERRVPTLAALDARPAPNRPKAAAMPRMVAADAVALRPQALPPQRPVGLVALPPTPRAASSGPLVLASAAAIRPEAEPAREDIRVLGWDVPGSRILPTRRDAVRTAEFIGGKAAAVGTGTASFVADAASAIGDTVSGVGGKVADAVGLR